MYIQNSHSLAGVSNKGTSQSHENHISTSSRNHPRTTNNSSNTHQMNNNNSPNNNNKNNTNANNNNNHTNEITTNDNRSTGIVETARQHLGAAMNTIQSVYDSIGTNTNNRNQSPTTTGGTEQTISFSKETTETGKTRASVRKTSRKKHPKRKERRKEKEEQKTIDRIGDRIAMAMDSGTDIGGGRDEEASIVETHKLISDHLHFESEFQDAGQEEGRDIYDDYSEPETDDDMPPMVGRMKDDASNDDSYSASHLYHTDNDNSSIKDSNDD